MYVPPEGSWKRSDFKKMILDLKERTGLSNREFANLIGISHSRFNSAVFGSSEHVEPEVVDAFISPFKFHDPIDATVVRQERKPRPTYGPDRIPPGYVAAGPVRDALLRFKEENNSSWAILADHLDMDRKVLINRFVGESRTQYCMQKDFADEIMRFVRRSSSLPPAIREEKFSVNPPKQRYVERARLIALLTNARSQLGLHHWKDLAEQLDMNYDTLRSHMHSKNRVRGSVYDRIEASVKDALSKHEKKVNFRYGFVERDYGL